MNRQEKKLINDLRRERKELVNIIWVIVAVALVIIIVLSSLLAVKGELKDNNKLSILKLSGVYTPLEKDNNYIVIVLDKRIDLHQQLAAQIQNAMNQINNQLKGGN